MDNLQKRVEEKEIFDTVELPIVDEEIKRKKKSVKRSSSTTKIKKKREKSPLFTYTGYRHSSVPKKSKKKETRLSKKETTKKKVPLYTMNYTNSDNEESISETDIQPEYDNYRPFLSYNKRDEELEHGFENPIINAVDIFSNKRVYKKKYTPIIQKPPEIVEDDKIIKSKYFYHPNYSPERIMENRNIRHKEDEKYEPNKIRQRKITPQISNETNKSKLQNNTHLDTKIISPDNSETDNSINDNSINDNLESSNEIIYNKNNQEKEEYKENNSYSIESNNENNTQSEKEIINNNYYDNYINESKMEEEKVMEDRKSVV